MEARASVLYGPEDLRIEIRSIPPPAPEEVQISVFSTGLCGSDIHYYTEYRNGDIAVKEPITLGHESAGVVVAVGSHVSGLGVGDKVALESFEDLPGAFHIPKEHCKTESIIQQNGVTRSRPVFRLPPAMSLDVGALLEPFAVAIHAFRRANLPPNSSVLVLGAGTVGLLVAAMAKISGSARVHIADKDQARLDFAARHAFADCTHPVPFSRTTTTEEDLENALAIAAAFRQAPDGGGEKYLEFDGVFECTGSMLCLQASIYASRPGGKVILIGMGNPIQTLPISAAASREIDLIGVFRYANAYKPAIELFSKEGQVQGLPDFSRLITHRFSGLESLKDAFTLAQRGLDDHGNPVLKVIIHMQDVTIHNTARLAKPPDPVS